MRKHARSRHAATHVQPLEPRRLLTLTPVGVEVPVPTAGAVIASDLAVADDGSFIIASRATGGGNETIAAVRYSADGQQVSSLLTIFSAPAITGVTGGPISVAMDADGDAVVAYVPLDRPTDGVFFRQISKEGVMSNAVLVDSPIGDEFFGFPSVSMDAGGGFFIGWTTNAPESVDDRVTVEPTVQMRAYDANGAPRAAQFTAATLTELGLDPKAQRLDIAAHPDGSSAVFAFENDTSFGNLVNFRRATPSGPLGDTVIIRGILPSGGPFFVAPAVAIHEDGSFLVAYSHISDVEPQVRGGFVERYNADSEMQGEPIEIAASLSEIGIETVGVAGMPDGGFVTSFMLSADSTETVYARRFDRSGAPDISGPVALASDGVLLPSVAADAQGGVVVAYHKDESLHFRRLASDVSDIASLNNGVLDVFGTPAGEAITVTADGSNIVVSRNTTTRETFDVDDVNVLTISGFGGDDTIINDTALPTTILGGAGNDKLLGGSGNDSLSGGDGKDKLLGRDGRDSLSGNAGNDTLEGGLGADRVAGNGGRDRLYGNGGNDRIYGGLQGDWLYGQGGNNQLFGEGGNDRLYADYPNGGGVDTLNGNGGDDILISADALVDHLFGDAGSDTSIADANDLLAGVELIQ